MSDELETRLRAAQDGLPGPTTEETALARARFLAAASAPQMRRGGGIRRRALAFALAVAAVLAAFGGGYAVASDDRPPAPATPAESEEPKETLNAGPGFLPAEGWDVVATGATTPPLARAAVAANVSLSVEDRSAGGPPSATAKQLGRNGVLFYAVFHPAGTLDAEERLLPLQLRHADAVDAYEGMPRDGSLRRLQARVGRYDVDVLIVFGAEQPSPGVLAAAAQQLGRLVVPACPTAQPLTAADLPAAEAFVLEWLGSHYQEDPRDLRGARATSSLGAQMPRGGAARTACGERVFGRTVEVDVVLPRLERVSASLSQLSYFVSRTPQGWVVWQRIH